jgi:hypothetical protein
MEISNSCDESLLDHLAGFMIFLSPAQSFWYSLDSSYDHEFHLSQRLGMSPQAYEYLLVAAGLGINHKRWGFTINKSQWRLFWGGHRFSGSNGSGADLVFETEEKRIDLNAFILGVTPEKRARGIFIRIGVRNEKNSPLTIETQRYQT